MASVLQVATIKDQGGNANAIEIANSSANVTINNLVAGTIGGGVSMASSGKTVRNITQVALGSDQNLTNDATDTTFFSPTYTPLFSGSVIQGFLMINGMAYNAGASNGRKILTLNFTGSGITDFTTYSNVNVGVYDYGGDGTAAMFSQVIGGQAFTTSTTDTITCNCKLKNSGTGTSNGWDVYANNTIEETFFTWIEYK